MFRTPQISVGSVIFRPALVNLQSGLQPMRVSAPLIKEVVHTDLMVMGHLVYAVAGDIVKHGVSPIRFSPERPGWRALSHEVANPKNGRPLGSRVYLTCDLPDGWTHVRILAVNKHRWVSSSDTGNVVRTFCEYRGEAESNPSMYVNYYRECYLGDLGASKSISTAFLNELEHVFDEDRAREKLFAKQLV